MKDDERNEKLRSYACAGKHRHASFDAAQQQAKIGKKNGYGMNKPFKLTAYHCQFCGFYHIGGAKKFKKTRR